MFEPLACIKQAVSGSGTRESLKGCIDMRHVYVCIDVYAAEVLCACLVCWRCRSKPGKCDPAIQCSRFRTVFDRFLLFLPDA